MKNLEWISKYKKDEEKLADTLPLEDKEIFLKYTEKEDEFYPNITTNQKIDSYLTYENEIGEKVTIKKFSELDEMPEVIKKFNEKNKMNAFINSKIDDGLIIKFDDNLRTDRIFSIKQELKRDYGISKLVMMIGGNSRVYISDELTSCDSAYSAQSMDIIIDQGAELNFILSDASSGTTLTNCNIITKGKLNFISLITNKKITRNRLWVDMKEGAEINIKQGVIGNGNAYFDIESEIIHSGRNTKSSVAYKAILDDHSKAVYKGVIKQEKGATNSYAYLSEHSLILNKNAKSISIPSLEIETNELKAYHAASSQPIDKKALFYVMSRGLDEGAATKIITKGFINSILETIEKKEFYELFGKQVEDELAGTLLKA
jgi:Fe-S cluster assembly scaffold protein SufB